MSAKVIDSWQGYYDQLMIDTNGRPSGHRGTIAGLIRELTEMETLKNRFENAARDAVSACQKANERISDLEYRGSTVLRHGETVHIGSGAVMGPELLEHGGTDNAGK